MEENIISAPGGRAMFMNKNSFYYNDKGKKSFSVKGLSGICHLNGYFVTIINGRVVSSSVVDEFLQNNPNLQGKTVGELKLANYTASTYGCAILLNKDTIEIEPFYRNYTNDQMKVLDLRFCRDKLGVLPNVHGILFHGLIFNLNGNRI
jgi:hypothetical protein